MVFSAMSQVCHTSVIQAELAPQPTTLCQLQASTLSQVLSQSIDYYIVFGTQLRYLLDAKDGWRVDGEGRILQNANWFLENLDRFALPVTSRASHELRGFVRELATKAEGLDEYYLSVEDATDLTRIMRELRPTLYAEAAGNIAYVVSDKRYSVEKLLGDVGSLFARGVYKRLPPIAQYDFSEAGLCVAFVRPTAAAFHALRGTEAVLRQFYRGVVRQRRIAEPWMWEPMMDDMRTQPQSRRNPDT